MKIILMHGKDTDPTQKWYPWFKTWCEESSLEFTAPKLPAANNPVLSDWLAALTTLKPDADTVLIGRSRGGVAILRWLESTSATRVKKVILLATNSGLLSRRHLPDETNFGFYTEKGFDFSEIRKHCDDFTVIHSKDDPWVPYDNGLENAEGLQAKLVTVNGYKHFGTGVVSIPELVHELENI